MAKAPILLEIDDLAEDDLAEEFAELEDLASSEPDVAPLRNAAGDYQAEIASELSGQRLDQALVQCFPEFSRARLQRWVRDGQVQVDGVVVDKPRLAVTEGQILTLHAETEAEVGWQAQDIPLEVVHADASILVINKPAGIVVHPAAGNHDGTLVNALLHYDPALAEVPRAGIVHRLDKDTSGLLVVARTLQAQASLVRQLQARTVSREYLALVQGMLVAGGTVDAPLGRHPVDRKRMAVVGNGREAITHYRVNTRYRVHTLIDVKLETGRTHQIRVHMAHVGHPLVGDPVYGGRARLPKQATPELVDALQGFRRQALHARRLELEHPESGEWLSWEAPIPEDFAALLTLLQADLQAHS
jgi:23S rRNA pseudouridine1911/1915/1917 synthase